MSAPPYSADAEAELLGICLVSSEAARRAMELVQPADFYVPRHAEMWAVMETLEREGGVIDPITVGIRLGEPTGVVDELTRRVFAPVPDACELGRVVREKATLRRALVHAEGVAAAVHAEDFDALDEAFADPLRAILPETPPQRIDVADLIAEPHPVEWVLPHLLARHEVVIWVGEPGHGKSTLLRQIAVCVASGLTPFHRSATETRRVLYVDCQDSRATSATAFGPLVALAGQRYQGGLDLVMRYQGMDLSSPRDQRWLEEEVAGAEADLVILGPLYNVVRGNERRSKHSEETAELAMDALTDLMVRRNVAVMIEAHAPHGDQMRVRGSKLWEDWPDFGFGLIKEGGDDEDRAMRVKRFRGDRRAGRRWPTRFVQGDEGSWPWEAI